MKVYILYYNKKFFAQTNNKKMLENFLSTRNEKFTYKKINMSDEDYEKFEYKYCSDALTNIYLQDKSSSLIIVGTVKEELDLNIKIDSMYDEMREICSYILSIKLKNKYQEIIDYLSEMIRIFEIDNDEYSYYSINTFKVFYNLNKDKMR